MPHYQLALERLVFGAMIAFAVPFIALAETERMTIALDPGHGGEDPGAEAMGVDEADLVLAFAERLQLLLEETEAFSVVLTRTQDQTVPLDARLTRAREGGADLFVSLHADALPPGSGSASGLTIYTLDDSDVPRADARLIERHEGDDILTGVALGDASDDVVGALVSLARRETLPRSQALAQSLLTTFAAGNVTVNSRPHRHGGFAVLKAADMPSVLIELGFLSNARDRERLLSDEWLQDAALAIRDGLLLWLSEDTLFREQTLQ